MGIYDREYYRGETRGVGWFTTTPVCKTIILINVLVFLLQELGTVREASLFDAFAATSHGVLYQGKVWQLLTAAFLHANLIHLLLNMYFLWVVGRELEPMYGPRDFLALYLSAAVFSTLGWAVWSEWVTHSPAPMVGASGAVFAVVVLYALYYPRRELLFMFVIPMEVWVFVGLLVASQVFLMLKGTESRTAVEAHVAGALYGYLFKRFDLRWSQMPWNRVRRPRLRVVPADPPRDRDREKPSARPTLGPTWSSNTASSPKPAAAAVVPEEQLDAKLDEVLAKIAREGRGGLTEEENRVLQEASRRARNRRSDRP
jgi:membrane associated rhomboid family serine protease